MRWLTRTLVGMGVVSVLLLVAVWWQWPDDQLHIVACDVGQGDAILITYGFQQVLVDAGPHDHGVLSCLGAHLPWWDHQLELVVMTHADEDHIGGMVEVLQRYHAATIMFNGDYKDSTTFKDTMQAVHQQLIAGSQVKLPILGLQWRFYLEQVGFFKGWVRNPQALTLQLLSPRVELDLTRVEKWLKTETILWDKATMSQVLGAEQQDSNDRSIVLLLQFGKTTALLTGDLEEKGELSLLASGVIHRVTILKVGHHGAKTSTSEPFLSALRPEISLVSVGTNNKYGHPSPEVMNRLSTFDSVVYRTDQQGVLAVVSNGEAVRVETER